MNTNHLKEFISLTKTLNYYDTADEMYISHSTLSKHIQALEKEVGVNLFDRTTRSVQLNQNGKLFLPYAKQIIESETNYYKVLNKDKVIHISSNCRITETIVNFKKEYQDIVISKKDNSCHDLIKELKNNLIDFAFIMAPSLPLDEDIHYQLYSTDYYSVIVHQNNHLFDYNELSFNNLKNEQFILFTEENQANKFLKDTCQTYGFIPKVILNGETGQQIVDYIKQNLGIAVLPKKAATPSLNQELKAINIVPEIPIEIYFCYQKKKHQSTENQLFLNYINKQ